MIKLQSWMTINITIFIEPKSYPKKQRVQNLRCTLLLRNLVMQLWTWFRSLQFETPYMSLEEANHNLCSLRFWWTEDGLKVFYFFSIIYYDFSYFEALFFLLFFIYLFIENCGSIASTINIYKLKTLNICSVG